jgi:hypothetical protein
MISGKDGDRIGVKYEVSKEKKYIVFLNVEMVDMEEFCIHGNALPGGTMVYGVSPRNSSIDEAIRIYEIEG